MSWTYLDLLYRFGKRIGGDYTDIRLAVAQGTLLWLLVKFEDVCKPHVERPLLYTSSFDNGLTDSKSTFKRLNGNILATSFTNLVSNHPIISVGWLVGWCLTSLFSTNKAIPETKGQGWRAIV